MNYCLQDEYPGLLSLVRMYVNSIDMDVDTRCTVLQYLRFISKRASGIYVECTFWALVSFCKSDIKQNGFSGELMTTASYLRKCVHNHQDYKKDSVVSDRISYDLLLHLKDISEGRVSCPELTGTLMSKTPQSYRVVDCPLGKEQTAGTKE